MDARTRDDEPRPEAESDLDPSAGSPDIETSARVAELEARCQELEERWLRAQADYQNLRRRGQMELEGALLRTMQPLLDELLLVVDYLDLALSSGATSEEARKLAEGVQLTRTKLARSLKLADVEAVPTSGVFDPALHEAAGSVPTDEQPPGTILSTVRPGYTWQGRILRPARVVVATSSSGPTTRTSEES